MHALTRLAGALLAAGVGCGDSQEGGRADAVVDAGLDSDRPDSAVQMPDAGEDAGKCCPIDPQPDCCMHYGGARLDGGRSCGRTCDGMPYPHDPRWKVGNDDQGCPRWIEPDVIDNECCGCPPSLESDAGG